MRSRSVKPPVAEGSVGFVVFAEPADGDAGFAAASSSSGRACAGFDQPLENNAKHNTKTGSLHGRTNVRISLSFKSMATGAQKPDARSAIADSEDGVVAKQS